MDRDAITEYVGRCQQLIESSPQMDEHEGQARTAVSRTARLEPVNYLHLLDGFAVSLRWGVAQIGDLLDTRNL